MAPTLDINEKDFSRAKALLDAGQINYSFPEAKSAQVADIDTRKYIVVPQDYSGLNYKYAVSSGRLAECSAIKKVVKELDLYNYQDTSTDSLGRDFVGSNTWFEFMKLNASLGLVTPDMQESFYYFKLLKDGAKNKLSVYDVSGTKVDSKFLKQIYDDFFKVQDDSVWRGHYIGTEFKKDGENIVMNSHHTLENGVLVPQKILILDTATLMEDKIPGIDLFGRKDSNYTSQGLPSKNFKKGNLFYHSPGKNSVAALDAGLSEEFFGYASLDCNKNPSGRNSCFGILSAKQLE